MTIRDYLSSGPLHHKDLFDLGVRELGVGHRTGHGAVVFGDVRQSHLTEYLPVGQHHRLVVLVEGHARHAADKPALDTVRIWQLEGDTVEILLAHRAVKVAAGLGVAVGCLQGRESSLYGCRKDGGGR